MCVHTYFLLRLNKKTCFVKIKKEKMCIYTENYDK